MSYARFAVAAALFAAVPAAAALNPGAKAPDFTTQASLAGKASGFTLSKALKKGPVVLYFFPAAFTPGCTAEAHEFAEATAEFAKHGATVIGLSADPIEKLNEFSVKECRNKFAVGTASPAIIAGYDVKLPAREGLSNRTSYVIAPDGRIIFTHSAMNPVGHVTGTLDAVKKWEAARKKG
ncbi:peroxiredoxin [Sphingomonas flavalba]|uniref:peroxiredoxin n=1 Tax=Sphingomonas flavalba TaxID=2559804 RepID=UPI00109D85B2|nr:peroxiredoxin [Sphingomonas flavalba]